MSTVGGNLALLDSPLIDGKSFLVLMKARGRFRNGADPQSQHYLRPQFRVTHKIPVQTPVALGPREPIIRQRKVIHSDLDVTCFRQQVARDLVQGALLAGCR